VLVSDDEYAFLTYDSEIETETGIVLYFEDPPEELWDYEITSVKLKVEQKILWDFYGYTDDWWNFTVGSEYEHPLDYGIEIYRPGTEAETTLSIDITGQVYAYYSLDWEYMDAIAVALYPGSDVTHTGEWYIDSVWIEVDYVYAAEGCDITVPVSGEVTITAYVTDMFGDPMEPRR